MLTETLNAIKMLKVFKPKANYHFLQNRAPNHPSALSGAKASLCDYLKRPPPVHPGLGGLKELFYCFSCPQFQPRDKTKAEAVVPARRKPCTKRKIPLSPPVLRAGVNTVPTF